ncbi:MAG: GntR family transcriptional regulator [Deltaproteobacteria bacterium]|nr:GntR family transcriptional regulator [Deltaproteobacteria bacterium]
MKKVLFKTKSRVAYDYLKESLMRGDIKPGEKIIARVVAEKFGVSEIPVREALKMLESQGLIEITPHIGAKVVRINLRELEEFYLIRSELEGLAARLASKYINIKGSNIARLEKIQEQHKEAIQSGDTEKIGELNQQFHFTIYRCSPYKHLYDMIHNLWVNANISRINSVFFLSPERGEETLIEHEQIIEALKRGCGDLAAEIIKKQKLIAFKILSKVISSKEQNKT